MTLGAGATTPLRLTAAYAMLVNGGKRITPTLIDRVQDRNGKTIFRADQRRCDGCSDVDWQKQPMPVIPDTREQVADPDSAYQMVTMMEGVVQRGTGDGGEGRRQADRRQDRNHQRLSRCLVRRLHPRPRRRRLCRLRRPGQPRQGRDRRACRGADLPRLHDRRAQGCAGHRFPHSAGHAALPRQRRDRAAGRLGTSRRSTRPTSPAPSPGSTATPG